MSGGAEAPAAIPAPFEPPPATAPVDDLLLRELVDGLNQAVVVTDGHAVTLLNRAAADLLPELSVGAWLAECAVAPLATAVTARSDSFEGDHRGRRLRGDRRGAEGRTIWYVRDVTEESARTDALLAERSRTAFLAEASGRLAMSLHVHHTLRVATALAVPFLGDAVLVVRRLSERRGGGGRLAWTCFADGPRGPVTGSGPAELADRVPGLTEALDGDPTDSSPWLIAELADLDFALPADFGRPGTALVVPMPGAGGAAGALVVVRRPDRPGFDEREIALVRQYAARAGGAVAAAELYSEQARAAQVLRAGLLPPALPQVPAAAIAGGYRPAGGSLGIGGDFYDAWATDRAAAGPGAAFALGDVCGKGTQAAILAGRVRQALHTLRLVETDPQRLIGLLDRVLLTAPEAAGRSQFATVLLGSYTAGGDGALDVRLAGGGHPAPLVARADGTVTPVPVGGMPVGAVPDAQFGAARIRLEPGDLLLAYSDGVTEARGGPGGTDWFGEARLRRALSTCGGMPAGAVTDRLLQIVDEWLDGQPHDDIALLALQAAPEAK